jgi:PQQ-dependent dehydrogenase (s-GDH family)
MTLTALLTAVVLGLGRLASAQAAPPMADTAPGASLFTRRIVATGLEAPFEVVWGPDGHLWATERTAGRVIRIDPSDGSRVTLLTVPEIPPATKVGMGGLLGMALHPELLQGTGQDYVYLAHTYQEAGDLRAKIRRYTYDRGTRMLRGSVDVLSGLPASDDHNGGRLTLGPDGRLYYSVGDQGHGQFTHACRRILAQDLPSAAEVTQGDWSAYQGKILRLEPDGAVPADNPVLAGLRSHVYSYGHRNPQGLAFEPSGLLYSSEHGPKTDDEVNLIEPGGNYGWPHVAGYRDDRAYEHADWPAAPDCERLTYSSLDVPASVPRQKESAWSHPDFVAPIRTFFTVEDGHDFRGSGCGTPPNTCWPSIAPSGLEVYAARDGGILGWGTSLLLPSLKHGTVYRVALSADGRSTFGEPEVLFRTTNRYRDLAIAPDGLSFYIATDASGATRGPDGGRTVRLEHPGAIIEFRHTDTDVRSGDDAAHRAQGAVPSSADRLRN